MYEDKEYIFITKIEYSKPIKGEDFVKMCHFPNTAPFYLDGSSPSGYVEVTEEFIKGYYIKERHDKPTLVIGWSNEVQKALDTPINLIEKQSNQISQDSRTISRLEKQNDVLELMVDGYESNFQALHDSFWKRLKYLFTRRV